MEADMFKTLGFILGFYSNCAIAWVTIVACDIVINKYLLKLSPKIPDFKKNKLYAINPVGFISFIVASGVSIMAFFGLLTKELAPYSPLIALILGIVMPPLIAIITQGKYYSKSTNVDAYANELINNLSYELFMCQLCKNKFEASDMSIVPLKNNEELHVCSLCETIN
jgi:hypothetical protein